MNREKKIDIQRSSRNPLITPRDVKPSRPDWEVIGVFNAGVAKYRDETILLLRVAERPRSPDPGHVLVPVLEGGAGRESGPMDAKTITLDRRDPELDFGDSRVVRDRSGRTVFLTSMSHLRLARSRDGERFAVDGRPAVWPQGRLESWGVEDPRITEIDGRYFITYSAVSEKGVAVGLISTEDFADFRREGLILAPTNKDAVLFPEKIGGFYYMIHRPVPEGIGMPEIWAARSPDLLHWGDHRYVMGVRKGTWENRRIGAGCVPIRTEEGWLLLYHGADDRDVYGMGAALLDLTDPSRVIARLDDPFLTPEAEYETNGFFRNVVFACGAIVEGDRVTMYYGAADDSMARVTFQLSPLLHRLLSNN